MTERCMLKTCLASFSKVLSRNLATCVVCGVSYDFISLLVFVHKEFWCYTLNMNLIISTQLSCDVTNTVQVQSKKVRLSVDIFVAYRKLL